MPPILASLFRSKILITAITLLALYSVAGFFVVPLLVEHYLPQIAKEKFHLEASIGKVRVNPFLLRVELNKFNFREGDGRPLLSFRRGIVDLETASLVHRAWVIGELSFDGLAVSLDVQKNGRLNFAALGDTTPAAKPSRQAKPSVAKNSPSPVKEPEERPIPFLLQHIAIRDSALTYGDQRYATPADIGFSSIQIEMQNLGGLPQYANTFRATATSVDGGSLDWQGEVKLFPFAMRGAIAIKSFQPARGWGFVQDFLNVAPPQGSLDLNAAYQYSYKAGVSQFQMTKIHFLANQLAVSQVGGAKPLVRLNSLEITKGSFDLATRKIVLPALQVRDGQFSAHISKDGTLDWQTLVTPQKTVVPKSAVDKKAPVAPWHLQMDAVQLEKIAIQATDASGPKPLALSIGNVGMKLKLSAVVGADAPALNLDQLFVDLGQLSLTEVGQKIPLASLKSVALRGGKLDTRKQLATVQQLQLRGGNTSVVKAADGRIPLFTILSDRRPSTEKPAALAKDKASPWHVKVDLVTFDGFRAAIQDQGYQPTLRYDLEAMKGAIKNLNTDAQPPVPFEIAIKVAQGGNISASGKLAANLTMVEASLTVDQLNLAPLQPLLASRATLDLKSGKASMTTQIQVTKKDGASHLQASGEFGLSDLLLNEAGTNTPALAWKQLDGKDVRFSFAPNLLTIKEVRLQEPKAKAFVFEDGSFNVAKYLKKSGQKGQDEQPKKESAVVAERAKEDENPFPITLDQLRIVKGTLDYSDQSLVLPFTAKIQDLGGSISGIASDAKSRANIQLKGRVEEYGLVKISGGLRPFAPKQYTNVRVEFSNVAMSPLSPYSATFAGRKIAAGKLSLDLQYKVVDSQMLGTNTVLLEKFALGERIASKKALDLPLDLAIALLTDSKGRINIGVPVAGNIDSPTFDYGKVIGKAITGALTKIVTAPFRALGGLFGGNADKFDAVAFDAGSDQLQPSQLEILRSVVKALEKRPQLLLVVGPRYQSKTDGAALRVDALRREVALELNRKFDADEEVDPVVFDDAKSQQALETLLVARAGADGVEEFKADYEKKNKRPAEQVNAALALVGRASEDLAFYEAMYQQLVILHPLAETDLQALAQRRGNVVVKALVEDAGLAKQRVRLDKIAVAPDKKGQKVETKLRLDAATGQ